MATGIARWEPFRDVFNLQQAMDRVFHDTGLANGQRHAMAINAYETEDALVFEVAVAGARKDQFDINYKDQFLTIKVNLGEEKPVDGARYHLRERPTGEHGRTLRLPFPVDVDKAKAAYNDGVLTLTLPKTDALRPRSIPIS